MFDRIRDFFDGLGPRERRLAGWFAVVLVVCGVAYVGFLIHDGLNDLERSNTNTRLLLTSLGEKRDVLALDRSKQGEVVAMIGEEAPALGGYVEKVAGEAGLQVRNQSEKPKITKGAFHELSSEVTLTDLTLDQLAKMLRGLETTNPTVVTQKLDIRRSGIQKEKLDRVTITVATYERARAKAEAKPAAGETAAGAPAAAPATETKP